MIEPHPRLRALFGIRKVRVSTSTIVKIGPNYHYVVYYTMWYFPSEKRGTTLGQRQVYQSAATGRVSPSPYHMP